MNVIYAGKNSTFNLSLPAQRIDGRLVPLAFFLCGRRGIALPGRISRCRSGADSQPAKVNTVLTLSRARLILMSAALLSLATAGGAAEIWKLDNLAQIGGQPITVLGAPQIREESGAKAMYFDGIKDGIFVPSIPVAGAKEFTIEILFCPAACDLTANPGQSEQRFFHLEDKALSRAMMETRVNAKGEWWLDHFLFSTTTRRIVSIDPKLVHPTNRWYWLALKWDGKTMTSYLDGEKEMENSGQFTEFGEGQISLGVRQNKVFWFKGGIREVRFHCEAIAADQLQRSK